MEKKNSKILGEIRYVRTEIDVFQKDGSVVTMTYPLFGKRYSTSYENVMEDVSKEGLLRPTTAQTLSLINLARRGWGTPMLESIIHHLKDEGFVTGTETLWTPEEVIVYDNVDGCMPLGKEALLKRFKEGDKAVRVIPYGFKTGRLPTPDFLKNAYVIAQLGDNTSFLEDIITLEGTAYKPYLNINRLGTGYTGCDDGSKRFENDTRTYTLLKLNSHSHEQLINNDDSLDLTSHLIDKYGSGYASGVKSRTNKTRD